MRLALLITIHTFLNDFKYFDAVKSGFPIKSGMTDFSLLSFRLKGEILVPSKGRDLKDSSRSPSPCLMFPRKGGHTVKLLYATFGFQIQEAIDTLRMNAS